MREPLKDYKKLIDETELSFLNQENLLQIKHENSVPIKKDTRLYAYDILERGQKNYNVSIILENDDTITSLNCGCGKKNCRHLACALEDLKEKFVKDLKEDVKITGYLEDIKDLLLSNYDSLYNLLTYLIPLTKTLKGLIYDLLMDSLDKHYRYILNSDLQKLMEIFVEAMVNNKYKDEEIYLIIHKLFKHFSNLHSENNYQLLNRVSKVHKTLLIALAVKERTRIKVTKEELEPVSNLFINVEDYLNAFLVSMHLNRFNAKLKSPYFELSSFFVYNTPLDLKLKEKEIKNLPVIIREANLLNPLKAKELMDFFEIYPLTEIDLVKALNDQEFYLNNYYELTKETIKNFKPEGIYSLDFYQNLMKLAFTFGEDTSKEVLKNVKLQVLNLFKTELIENTNLHLEIKDSLPFRINYDLNKPFVDTFKGDIIITPNSVSKGDCFIGINQNKALQGEVILFTDLNHRLTHCHCSICKSLNKPCNHLEVLLNHLNKLNVDENLKTNYLALLTKTTDIRSKRRSKNLKKIADKKLENYEKKLSKISEDELIEKIDIIPNLSTDGLQIQNLETYNLNFKIGYKDVFYKLYLDKFNEAMQGNLSYTYGKKLSFKHNLDNLTDRAKLLYNLISVSPEKDSLTINQTLVSNLLCALKPYGVSLNNENYSFSGNLSLNTKISENGDLTIDKDLGNDYVAIFTTTLDFLFIDQKYYQIVYQNKKEKLVIEDLLIDGSFNINNSLDEFLINLYPYLKKSLIVDEKFVLTDLFETVKVKTYLDYEKQQITLRSEFYKKNNLINYEDLKENDLKDLKPYFNELLNLGFKDKTLKDEKKIISFLNSDLKGLKAESQVYLSKTLERLYKPSKLALSFNINNKGSSLCEVFFDSRDYTDQELYKVYDAYKKHQEFVLLKDNLIDLKSEESKELFNLIDDLNLNPKSLTEPYDLSLYKIFKIKNDGLINYNLEAEVKKLILEIKDYQNAPFTLSESILKELRSYQLTGFKWLNLLTEKGFGCILADDMGIGKSLESIALIDSQKTGLTSLIICPKNIIYNWENEFNKWAPHLSKALILGNKEEREVKLKAAMQDKVDVLIASYEIVRIDNELFKDYQYGLIILDEAQNIKNPLVERSKAVKRLKAAKRVALTGTPIENSLVDLWSIFDFLMPGYLYSYKRFTLEVLNLEDKELIKKKIMPFVLRRTKKEVLKDLPEKTEETVYLSFNDEALKVYQANLLVAQKNLLKGLDNKIEILSMITLLREICVDPKLVYHNFNELGSKTEFLLSFLEKLIKNNHKTLIFSQFTKYFEFLVPYLEEAHIKYFILTGKTSAKDRQMMVEEFNMNKDYKVFLISLKAGGVGLNLVGADTVIHMDPWWNYAIESQASDRVYRIGQKNPVTIYKLVIKDSIEEKVLKLQEEKKSLSLEVINENDEEIKNLALKDYKALLK